MSFLGTYKPVTKKKKKKKKKTTVNDTSVVRQFPLTLVQITVVYFDHCSAFSRQVRHISAEVIN